MYTYVYAYIYIYIDITVLRGLQGTGTKSCGAASLRAKICNFAGFDSSRILVLIQGVEFPGPHGIPRKCRVNEPYKG